MKKILIEVQEVFDRKVLRIVGQTHKCHEFGDNGVNGGARFLASNGFLLYSEAHPQSDKENALYVRGCEYEQDYQIVVVPNEEWLAKLRVAVREYNQHFADKKPESKPGYEVIE